MIGNCVLLCQGGSAHGALYFQFFLGVPGGAPATPKSLLHLVESIPAGSPWAVDGIGREGAAMAALAIVLGGHARVGLEDQLEYADGELATSNAQLVARVARLAAELGRELATPADARRILGLKGAALAAEVAP